MRIRSNEKKPAQVISKDTEGDTWKEFFVIAEHWQSDLIFFADELRFLRNLMGKYVIWLTDERNIEDARVTAAKLTKLDKLRATIDERVANHLKHLARLVANPASHHTQGHNEHGELEIALSAFLKDFRSIKKEVFELTERVVESENAQHLLGR